ncbi:unnamed protein product [Lactuca saligna]|uniref:TIR domain-containing protein n=1 Tax=Lactuca saligna TaxID=75948 RepID=A0AA35V4J1_LACSI|nr:unnamed protein product [Lactuca saligna]
MVSPNAKRKLKGCFVTRETLYRQHVVGIGQEVRKSFLDHLYVALQWQEIVTFKDDKNLTKLKIIKDDLFESIEESKFHIIILSKPYAASTWHEAKVIKRIVQKISLELRSTNLKADEYLVGMESRIRDIISSLEMDVEDGRMIGIKGIGGGGKMTLATAVFDKTCFPFEVKSIVGNIREVSKSSMFGLQSLQKQVLSIVIKDINFIISSVRDGKSLMKKNLPGKKVLLVLDDMDHLDQLEALAGELNWFKGGSRIIITTRDEQLLVAHGVKVIHDVTLLSQSDATRVFNRYAFGKDIPINMCKELSLQVVHYVTGLPLTIKVLGSFLCGKDELEWKDAPERLKKIPLKETLEKLELSYTILDHDYKDIFLDVACLLEGWRKDDAIRELECCELHARIGLRVLEQRSLITITHNQELGMHDHIQELGWNMVRRLHPTKPIRHSRLWMRGEIEDVLTYKSVAATIAIATHTHPWLGKQDLTILDCGLLPNLEKLNFSNCSDLVRLNTPHGSLRRLAQLDLNGCQSLDTVSFIKQLEMLQVLEDLVFLDFSHSSLTTLDCGLVPNLQKLNIEKCYQLVELHVPIGCLRSLVYLDIGVVCFFEVKMYAVCGPHLQASAAEELGSLQVLNIHGCKNLKRLQSGICGLRSLKHLNLVGSAIEEVPKDLGHLESLETLDLSSTPLKHLPNSICKLKHLKTLHLASCKDLKKLPKDLGLLESLEELSLQQCKIRDVPISICKLKHLRELNLRCCDQLERLPKKLRDLERLKELNVYATGITHLPQSISLLKGLKIVGFE